MSLAPVIRDVFSAPFFEAAAEGVLLLRWSPSEDTWSEPSARVCSTTQAQDLEWRAASGRGRLVSWTIKPGRRTEDGPRPDMIIGIVEVDEGPWLAMQLREIDDRSVLRVDAPIVVGFERADDESDGQPVGRLAS